MVRDLRQARPLAGAEELAALETDPLAGLVRDLLAARRGHARSGAGERSRWLFPGGQPGQSINTQHLRSQLQRLGIRVGDARSAALLQLAADLPPAVCARLLGIHPTVAVAWQRAAGGDWTAYAAQITQRVSREDWPMSCPSSAGLSPDGTPS